MTLKSTRYTFDSCYQRLWATYSTKSPLKVRIHLSKIFVPVWQEGSPHGCFFACPMEIRRLAVFERRAIFWKNFLTFLPLSAYTINRCSACGVGKRAGNGHSPGQFLRCIFCIPGKTEYASIRRQLNLKFPLSKTSFSLVKNLKSAQLQLAGAWSAVHISLPARWNALPGKSI